MDLTSWSFAAALSVVVLIGLVLCTVSLSKCRKRKLGRIRSTLCAVGAGLLVLLLIVADLNVTLGWVKYPRDLIGLGTSVVQKGKTGQDVHVEPEEAPQSQTVPDTPWFHASLPATVTPGAEDATSAQLLKPIGSGVWQGLVHGPRSQMTQDVMMWVPEGFEHGNPGEFNVVVFLHGFPGSNHGPLQALDVAHTMTTLTKKKLLKPTIFVVPDLREGGQQPDCVDIAGRPSIETFVTKDLVAALRAKFPQLSSDRSGWAIAGISAGAYCAPILAMRHTDTFTAAIAMGAYDPPELGALAHASAQVRDQFTVSTMMEDSPMPVAMYVAGTKTDLDSENIVEHLTKAATPRDDLATMLQTSGGHSWTTWATQLPAGLIWWQSAGQIRPEEANELAAQAGLKVGSETKMQIDSMPLALSKSSTAVGAGLAMVSSTLLSVWLVPRVGKRAQTGSGWTGKTEAEESSYVNKLVSGERGKAAQSGFARCTVGLTRFVTVTGLATCFAVSAIVVINWFSGFCETWAELGQYASMLMPPL